MSIGNRSFGFVILLLVCLPLHSSLGDNPNWVEKIRKIQAQAESGDPAAQTALGDVFQEQKLYTNAVRWYRLAAQNGSVSAQLALAGNYVSGRGVAEDRRQAAFWLRRAADSVEFPVAAELPSPPVGKTPAAGAPKTIIITKQNDGGSNGSGDSMAVQAQRPGKLENLFTNVVSRSTREARIDNLVIVEPELQERNTTPQPSGGSR